MGFSRQEYWSGLPCPSPGDLPDPGTEPRSLTLQADSLPSESSGKCWWKPEDTKTGERTSFTNLPKSTLLWHADEAKLSLLGSSAIYGPDAKLHWVAG